MRDKRIDIAKGIGIILVVLGHCSIPPISTIIYLFHMPLFFFISGYLYNDNNSKDPYRFFKKKFFGLYVPYAMCEIIFTLLRNFLLDVGIYSSSYYYFNHYVEYLNLKELIITIFKDICLAGREPLCGTLWFSVVLIFVNIMFLIISIFSEKMEIKLGINGEYIRLFLVFSLFFIGNIATKKGITIPRCNNSLVMLAVFYLGVIFHKNEERIVYKKIYILISFLIIIMNSFYGTISVNQNMYLSPDFLIVNCLVGSYMILGIATKINMIKKGKLLEYIGKHSFSIMILHYSAFLIVSKILLVFFKENKLYEFPVIKVNCNWIQNIITVPYLLVGLFVPLGVALLFEKIKIKWIKGNV
ncbi:MAG: acyltransferase family protein [Lachnospiraceae bacterium]